MCIPAPLIAPLMLAGTVMQGVGAYQGKMNDAANFDMQAEQADQQADQQRTAGAHRLDRAQDNALRIGGQQRAAAAEGGIATEGSFAEVQDNTAAELDLDMQAIRFNTELQVKNKEVDAKINRKNASSSRKAAPLAFLAPVLGNATKISEAFGE